MIDGAAGEERPRAARRDEWSEGAVERLLDAYESKWALRSRAKLKGRDWAEVARLVSSGQQPAARTPTQCKNKIESMKKRYRSESAAAAAAGGSGSRWPLFARLDRLVRCRPTACARTPPSQSTGRTNEVAAPRADRPPATQDEEEEEEEEDCVGGNTVQPDEMGAAADHRDAATPKERRKKERRRKKKKKEEEECWKETEAGEGNNEVLLESVQWLAEAALRMEQARAEAAREVEKMRAEAEAKKGEMDLRRTEIIADTQLRIAAILAARSGVGLDHLPTADDR